ncbi:succinate dehydrogenase cytochrome b556 subunit-like [Tubulanus polymorphus]|uniref:succinate dehydrogenase cytochrome b556 subunit-like n=1 Tax=Tubulanus polymorphus TaxID=672921 RepID=UPI003DA67BDD
MSAILRLATRRCLLQRSTPFMTRSLPITNDQRAIKEMEYFWHKNEVKLSRPMSPHLSIYKVEVTSLLSITHRLTGVGLSVGLIGLGWLSLYNTNFRLFADGALELVGPWGVFATKAVLVWGMVYHLLNGIRHLVWDRAVGLKISAISKSGLAMGVASVVLALGLAAL